MTDKIKTYVVVKELSKMGGNYRYLGVCNILTGFCLLLAVVTIRHVHRLKHKCKTEET